MTCGEHRLPARSDGARRPSAAPSPRSSHRGGPVRATARPKRTWRRRRNRGGRSTSRRLPAPPRRWPGRGGAHVDAVHGGPRPRWRRTHRLAWWSVTHQRAAPPQRPRRREASASACGARRHGQHLVRGKVQPFVGCSEPAPGWMKNLRDSPRCTTPIPPSPRCGGGRPCPGRGSRPIGDLTSALPPELEATASFVPRAHGVLAGRLCADEAMHQIDPTLELRWDADDGDHLDAGRSSAG